MLTNQIIQDQLNEIGEATLRTKETGNRTVYLDELSYQGKTYFAVSKDEYVLFFSDSELIADAYYNSVV